MMNIFSARVRYNPYYYNEKTDDNALEYVMNAYDWMGFDKIILSIRDPDTLYFRIYTDRSDLDIVSGFGWATTTYGFLVEDACDMLCMRWLGGENIQLPFLSKCGITEKDIDFEKRWFSVYRRRYYNKGQRIYVSGSKDYLSVIFANHDDDDIIVGLPKSGFREEHKAYLMWPFYHHFPKRVLRLFSHALECDLEFSVLRDFIKVVREQASLVVMKDLAGEYR